MQRLSPREIVVPGSIANLGPGFDTLGLAVTLYLRLQITNVARDRRGRLRFQFADGPIGGRNRIADGFRALGPLKNGPSIDVLVRSEIPPRGGLGSSAAATVAGLKLREWVDGRRSGDEILAAASRIEGHADNVAPSLFGGMTSCCQAADGAIRVARWPWPRTWRIVVATPETELATSVSRQTLPRTMSVRDAVFNLQHMALLLGALQSANADDFGEALRDRMHQPHRQRLVPGLRRLLAMRHPDVIGFCLSGAGPSIAAFTTGSTAAAERILKQAYRRERIGCVVRTVHVHSPFDRKQGPSTGSGQGSSTGSGQGR